MGIMDLLFGKRKPDPIPPDPTIFVIMRDRPVSLRGFPSTSIPRVSWGDNGLEVEIDGVNVTKVVRALNQGSMYDVFDVARTLGKYFKEINVK